MAISLAGRQQHNLRLATSTSTMFRTVLRQTRKQSAAQRGPIAAYARGEFERHRDVNPKDYQMIEHLVRKGKRQLDMLEQSSVTGVQFWEGH